MQILLSDHFIIVIILLASTFAIHAGAGSSTLALTTVLSCCWGIHDVVTEALVCLNDLNSVAVSLLHTLGLVRTVAIAAGRHGAVKIDISLKLIKNKTTGTSSCSSF
ncbi:hypothetical protein [Acinetobacter baumannii]|uniref:hypothetical protein n=1 Tax=Acinetobacter baumannii TaxID=470 RepID=UPI0033976272